MKRLALTVAAAAMAWLGTTTEGTASPFCGNGSSTYISTYSRCGCPVYVQRYIAYYDHCNRPVWRTRVLPVSHRCRSSYRPPHCDSGRDFSYQGQGYSQNYGGRGGSSVVIRSRW